MKTRQILTTMMAALLAVMMPLSTIQAVETADTTMVERLTVNGKPATPQQKAVAKKMAAQGAQMAAKGVKMATAAIANPQKAKDIANEMEAIGDEMDRLGDSLQTLSEDTTFLYTEPDSTELAGDDIEDFIDGFEDGFGSDFPWLHTWWGKLLGGGLGLLGGLLAILAAIFVIVLLFAIFTSPLWVIALIIWLLVRDSKKSKPVQQLQEKPITKTTPDNTESDSQSSSQEPQMPIAQPYPNENDAMWKSGIMYTCVGLGLVLLFISIGLEGLWGVGALVACIGVAKIAIAKTSHKKDY